MQYKTITKRNLEYQKAPIGLFDSGAGGVGILKTLVDELPGEDFIYYGDVANNPYGVRSEQTIRQLSMQCVEYLRGRGCKTIVVACNTASSAAVSLMRQKHEIPFVAIEPAIRPAARLPREGKVIVLATEATIRQDLFNERIREYGLENRVIGIGAPELVELVEANILDGPEVEQAIEQLVRPHIQEKAASAVLGCTHFLHQRSAIETVLGRYWPGIPVLDGNAGTARQLLRILRRYHIRNPRMTGGQVEFVVNMDDAAKRAQYQAQYESLLKR